MGNTGVRSTFDAYSAYYDALYREKDYRGEVDYVLGLVDAAAQPGLRILDLGCGTGAHAVHFAERGCTVLGVDLSRGMIERAEVRRRHLPAEIAERIEFALGDARSFRTDGRFDIVVALFHVLSYQTLDEDVRALIGTAEAHLVKGGSFVADYWYGPAVLRQRPERRSRRITSDAVVVNRVAEPEHDCQAKTVNVRFTLNVMERATGRRRRLRENHLMRYFEPDEIRTLAGSTFELVRSSAWLTDVSPGTDDWGAVAVLRKTQ